MQGTTVAARRDRAALVDVRRWCMQGLVEFGTEMWPLQLLAGSGQGGTAAEVAAVLGGGRSDPGCKGRLSGMLGVWWIVWDVG